MNESAMKEDERLFYQQMKIAETVASETSKLLRSNYNFVESKSKIEEEKQYNS